MSSGTHRIKPRRKGPIAEFFYDFFNPIKDAPRPQSSLCSSSWIGKSRFFRSVFFVV